MNPNIIVLATALINFVLAISFSFGPNASLGKSLYFLGAFILTVGVSLME